MNMTQKNVSIISRKDLLNQNFSKTIHTTKPSKIIILDKEKYLNAISENLLTYYLSKSA